MLTAGPGKGGCQLGSPGTHLLQQWCQWRENGQNLFPYHSTTGVLGITIEPDACVLAPMHNCNVIHSATITKTAP